MLPGKRVFEIFFRNHPKGLAGSQPSAGVVSEVSVAGGSVDSDRPETVVISVTVCYRVAVESHYKEFNIRCLVCLET